MGREAVGLDPATIDITITITRQRPLRATQARILLLATRRPSSKWRVQIHASAILSKTGSKGLYRTYTYTH